MSALVRIHEITHHVGEGDGARHAAIYQHQYTINEGGVVRCQEQCSGGNFVRRAKSGGILRSEEHTSELQSLMRISYAVFCLKKKKNNIRKDEDTHNQK